MTHIFREKCETEKYNFIFGIVKKKALLETRTSKYYMFADKDVKNIHRTYRDIHAHSVR